MDANSKAGSEIITLSREELDMFSDNNDGILQVNIMGTWQHMMEDDNEKSAKRDKGAHR